MTLIGGWFLKPTDVCHEMNPTTKPGMLCDIHGELSTGVASSASLCQPLC